MQPTLVITAPIPGMVYINGHFAGETSAERPLFAPVAPFGPVYLEYRPLEEGWLSLARRLVMSGGRPMSDSLPDSLFAVLWPEGITEIEFSPGRILSEAVECFSLASIPCRMYGGQNPVLEAGACVCALPENACRPELLTADHCLALTGRTDCDEYLLTLSADASMQTGFLRADRFDYDSDGTLHAVTRENDITGHATLERWQLTESGPQLISSERIWEDGIPRRPSSAEEAALAAVEAALKNDLPAAESFLSPAVRGRLALTHLTELGSACMPMKYALPGSINCIAMLSIEGDRCASVRPLYYHADLLNGEWLITDLHT